MLGVHVGKATKKTLAQSIDQYLRESGCNALQIFTHGPRNLTRNTFDADEVAAATYDADLTVHSAYSTTGIWNYDKTNINTPDGQYFLEGIKSQIKACKDIGAWGLVIHISKILPSDAADTAKIIRKAFKQSGIMFLIEMVASKADPDKTYETPEKIDNLTTLIGANEAWWGWCVDTAHIWGAGVDIRTYEQMHAWLSSITYKKKIKLFHLNGSSSLRGSGRDNHEAVFSSGDRIWHGIAPERSGVRAIIEFATMHQVPIICEIKRGSPGEIAASMDLLQRMLKHS